MTSTLMTCLIIAAPFPFGYFSLAPLCSEIPDLISTLVNLLITFWLFRATIIPFSKKTSNKTLLYVVFFLTFGSLYIATLIITILRLILYKPIYEILTDILHMILSVGYTVFMILFYINTAFIRNKLTKETFASLHRRLTYFLYVFIVFSFCFVIQTVLSILRVSGKILLTPTASLITACMNSELGWFLLFLNLFYCYNYLSLSYLLTVNIFFYSEQLFK